MSGVDDLTRDECIDHWTKLHGKPPPKYTSMQFIQQALAYEAQVRKSGGQSVAVKKALRSAAKSAGADREGGNRCASSTDLRRSTLSLRSGMHLVREWNGRTYQVEVLDKGFRLDGRTYRSLSAVARKITGAHWSGPRFFGLLN